MMIWGLASGWAMNPLSPVQIAAVAIVGVWTLFTLAMWVFILYPMVIIAFVRVYHELTDGQVASVRQPEIRIA
jgi:hypothetical protein